MNLRKELFPAKTPSHHRRSDAFDAADEAADLFAGGMSLSQSGVIMKSDSSFGRLHSDDPEPQYETRHDTRDVGISIRGASMAQDSGISIVGAANTHVATLRELFPCKMSNSGKELFKEKIQGRGLRRNKAEDMFH